MSIQSTPGVDLGKIFDSGLSAIGDKGKALQAKMDALMSKEKVNPEDMIQVQFEMGQYNVLMESISTVTKSLTDTMKSLAQRTA